MSSALLTNNEVRSVADLRGSQRRVRKEKVMRALLFSAALISVLISALIVWTLFQKAGVFLIDLIDESGIGALIDDGKRPGWYPRQARFDLPTIIIGTLIVSGISIVVVTTGTPPITLRVTPSNIASSGISGSNAAAVKYMSLNGTQFQRLVRAR